MGWQKCLHLCPPIFHGYFWQSRWCGSFCPAVQQHWVCLLHNSQFDEKYSPGWIQYCFWNVFWSHCIISQSFDGHYNYSILILFLFAKISTKWRQNQNTRFLNKIMDLPCLSNNLVTKLDYNSFEKINLVKLNIVYYFHCVRFKVFGEMLMSLVLHS